MTAPALKPKHLRLRADQADRLAQMSTCPRGKYGTVIIDPASNVIVGEGFNGPPRGQAGELCGGDVCDRDVQKCASGTQAQIGCHHSESNAIANAARLGRALKGTWLIVNGEPCMMCARLIHHAGIERVYYKPGGFLGTNGLEYLEKHGVQVWTLTILSDMSTATTEEQAYLSTLLDNE